MEISDGENRLSKPAKYKIVLKLTLEKSVNQRNVPCSEAEYRKVFQQFEMLYSDVRNLFEKTFEIKDSEVGHGFVNIYVHTESELKKLWKNYKQGSIGKALDTFFVDSLWDSVVIKDSPSVKPNIDKEQYRLGQAYFARIENDLETGKSAESFQSPEVMTREVQEDGRQFHPESTNVAESAGNKRSYADAVVSPVNVIHSDFGLEEVVSSDRSCGICRETKNAEEIKYSSISTFFVYLPKSVGSVKTVFLHITSESQATSTRSQKMHNVDNSFRLWTVFIKAAEDSVLKYYYSVKQSYIFSSPIINENDKDKVVQRGFTHRDIFESEIEDIDIVQFYKSFLKDILWEISTQDSLYLAVKHYVVYLRMLDNDLRKTRFRHELIRYCTECFIKQEGVWKATFCVYFISKISRFEETFVQSCKVQPERADALLSSLKKHRFERIVETCQISEREKMLNTIIFLARKCCATWYHLVLKCASFLPVADLIRNQVHFDCDVKDNQVVLDAVSEVLSVYNEEDKTGKLLIKTIENFNSYFPLLKIYQTMRVQFPIDSQVLVDVRDRVVSCAKDQLKIADVDTIISLVRELIEVDSKLLKQLSKDVTSALENALLRCNSIPDLQKIKQSIFLYCDDEHFGNLLRVIAGSSVRATHDIFLDMLVENDRAKTLSIDELSSCVTIWIQTAEKFKPNRGFCKSWNEYILQIRQALESYDNDLRLAADKTIEECISHFMCDSLSISKPSADDLKFLQTIMQVNNDIEKSVLRKLYREIQDVIVKITDTSQCWDNQANLKLLVWIVIECDFFKDNQSAKQLLNVFAKSETRYIHSSFLNIMSVDKFWYILAVDEVGKLLEQWMSCAKKHCMKRSQNPRSQEFILYLYEYLTEVKKLPFPPQHQGVLEQIEFSVKQECIEIGPNALMEIISSDAARNICPEALDLLESHKNGTQMDNLTSRELELWLNRLGDTHLNISERSNFSNLKSLLSCLHYNLEKLPEMRQIEQLLTSSAFLKNVFFHQGIYQKELENNQSVQFISSILDAVQRKILMSTMTVQEYFWFQKLIKEQGKQVEIFMEIVFRSKCNFAEKFESFNEIYSKAKSKYVLVKFLYRNILARVKNVVEISDLEKVKCRINDLKIKFKGKGNVPFCELTKCGFFGILEDFIIFKDKLALFCEWRSFLALCKTVLPKICEVENDIDDVENSLPFLFGDEKHDVVTSFTVLKFIEGNCIPLYKNWLEEVAIKATLDSVMRYVEDDKTDICKEIKAGSKLVGVKISNEVFSALEFLQNWNKSKQKIKTIQLLMAEFDLQDTQQDVAIDEFLHSLNNPMTVTVRDLAAVLQVFKYLLTDENDDWWALLEELSKASSLISFLKESIDDDFRYLIDAVEERAEQTIDESVVSDLIRVKQFLQPFLRRNFQSTDELFECFSKAFKALSAETKEMPNRINNCSHHVHGLTALYQHVANRGELTKEIIGNVMSKGKFKWNLGKGNSVCTVSVDYKTTKKDKNCKLSFCSEDLTDLRSRALLLSTSIKRDQNEEGAKKLKSDMQKFIKAVDTAQEISLTVSELYYLGHFTYKTFTETIFIGKVNKDNKDIQCKLSELRDSLVTKLETWTKVLNQSRKQFKSLNYLFSDQLSLVGNYLTCEESDLQQLQNLLYYVHPGSTSKNMIQLKKGIKKSDSEKDELSKTTDPDEQAKSKLKLIGNALDQMMKSVKYERKAFPNNKDFTRNSKDLNAVVQSGSMFIVQLEIKSTQTIPVLLSLFRNTENHFPIPSEVIFCHEWTSWEEIHLIILRCINSAQEGTPQLHCICNVEKLPNSIQYDLVDSLTELLTSHNNSPYRLALICRAGLHDPIIDHFSSYVHRLQGFDTALMQFCLQNTWSDVTVVTSTVPGLGKTENILSAAHQKNCTVKTVCISGPFSREVLVSRLQKQNLTSKDMLHLDIAEVDDVGFLDACLFEYIFLGCFCSGTKVACLPTKHISIEIANTVQNYLIDSLVVISSFRRICLEWKITNFMISEEIFSPVQIVCQYIKALDEGTLDFVDICFTGAQIVKPISDIDCRELIQKHFSNTQTDLSFSIMEIFLNVFSQQLKKLSASHFFRVKNLKAMLGAEQSLDVRSQLVKAFMEVAKEFACRSVHACRSFQNEAQTNGNDLKNEQPAKKLGLAEMMTKRVEGMLHWTDTNHLLVTFNKTDSQTVSVLYREIDKVPKNIKELFKSQLKKDLPDLNALSQTDLYIILERISKLKVNEQAVPDNTYALTPDNVLKMFLILQRIRANVPVVIMGDTGCGKTSLIRYLAHLCETRFEHFCIHAGISIEKITDVVSNFHRICLENPNHQVWLFFDEMNTCDHIALISEIICHHKLFGKVLARNLIFLAACNPYRLRKTTQIMTAGLDGKIKMDKFSKLVYRVHPLPELIIDYVWDYGTLHQKDELSYIERMANAIFKNSNSCWNLRNKIIQVLAVSQRYIQEIEGNDWCVSLRDVHRCIMLMEIFLKMLIEKSKYSGSEFSSVDENDRSLYESAIVLALAHCYQSRISTTKSREEFWKRCAYVLCDSELKYKYLLEIVKLQQMDLLNRMDLPQGIAKNTALRENVFVILVCILNRIPIFLVGKPGCSKSLSVQLIKNNLRGKDSIDPYFQTLPNLYIVSYQCSESSTSEGIIKVFEKAERYRKANRQLNALPVVLLDEIGLAETSRFNPLKVLHGLLEPASGKLPEVAVVGISNWSLDAAKMNRAVHLSRPDMDAHDLYETGKSISMISSPTQKISFAVKEETLEALANAYYKYQKEQRFTNFHGLRDYYSLIKYVSKMATEDEEHSMSETDIIQQGLLRNFGGLVNEVNEIIGLFLSSVDESQRIPWKVEDIIRNNLNDLQARHLMIITSGDLALGVLLQCLTSLNRNPTVIFGSKFQEDQTEDYSYRILNRIILCMETGSTLLLKDLDTIYGSLYDMLNQNYTIVGKKKNCRIALGPHSNPMCQVRDEFRCIVLVEGLRVDYSDPPFLNRFEKQILRFDDVIKDDQMKMITDLNKWIESFSCIPHLPFQKTHSFLGINSDLIASVVYQTTRIEETDSSFDDLFKKCQDTLLWLVPPDAVLRLTKTVIGKSQPEMKYIKDKYFQRPIHNGLSNFLESFVDVDSKVDLPPMFNGMPGLRIAIYTHSNIHLDFSGLACYKNIQVEKLGAFKSEKQLTKQIRNFFDSDKEMLILQCHPKEDGQHIPLAKYQLEEIQQEYVVKKTIKNICIIFHLERSSDADHCTWQFNFLSGWRLLAVDSLEDQITNSLTEIRHMSICDLLKTDFYPLKQCILDNLIWSFTCTSSSYGERSIEEFSELVRNISNSDIMVECLSEQINKIVAASEKENSFSISDPNYWQVEAACDIRLLQSATSFVDALKQYLKKKVTTPLANVIHKLEDLSAWHSFFSPDEMKQNLWKQFFSDPEFFSMTDIKIPHGPESFKIARKPLNYKFPFSQIFLNKLDNFKQLFKSDLYAIENELTDNEEANKVKFSVLFDKYKELFEKELIFFNTVDSFAHLESDFLDDFCNYLSRDYLLEDTDRISIARWLLDFKSQSTSSKSNHVTESVLCLWRYESLFHALLQLMTECKLVLPHGINYNYLLSQLDAVCEIPNLESEIEQTDASGHCDYNHELATILKEMYYLDLQPEEKLVHIFCQLLLPRPEILKINGIQGWQTRVCSVLSFCSSVSCYPVSLHTLRIFNDLATILLHCKINIESIEDCLLRLSNGVNSEKSVDSRDMLNLVFSMSSHLEVDARLVEDIQRFMCMFISRIIDINAETELFEMFLDRAAEGTLADVKLSYLEPLLHRILLEYEDSTQLYVLFTDYVQNAKVISDFPHLRSIDLALQAASFQNPLLLVLCSDVIQSDAFAKKNLYENLYSIQSTADRELLTFKMAADVVANAETVSLQMAVSVAFIREFLFNLSKKLSNDILCNEVENYRYLYQNVNAVLVHHNWAQIFLLKQLKLNNTFFKLKEMINTVESVLSCFEQVSFPEYETALVLGHCILGKSAKQNLELENKLLEKDDKVVLNYLSLEALQKPEELIQSLLHVAYLPNAIRPLTDAEKQVGPCIMKHGDHMSQPVKNFMLYITNIESFGVDWFQLKPDVSYLHLQRACFLLHLISLLVSQEPDSVGNLLHESFFHPTSVIKANILSKLSFESHTLSKDSKDSECVFVMCRCWSKVAISKTSEEHEKFIEKHCPVCGVEWDNLGSYFEILKLSSVVTQKGMMVIAKEIFKLLFIGSNLCSFAVKFVNPLDLTAIGIESLDEYSEELKEKFTKSWNVLSDLMQMNIEDLCLFLHYVVESISKWRGDFKLQDPSSVNTYLNDMIKAIMGTVLLPSLYEDLKHYEASIATTSGDIKHFVQEIIDQEIDINRDCLFRQTKERTLADMNFQFHLHRKEQEHPVIELFLRMWQKLVLLKHILPLMKWAQLCHQAADHQVTRKESKTMTANMLMESYKGMHVELMKDNFQKFRDSWSDLKNDKNLNILKSYDGSLVVLPQFHLNTLVQDLISENSEAPIYKVLNVLVQIQNDFLDEILAIALKGNCPSISFLKKIPSEMAVIKCRLVQNVKEEEIINIDIDELFESLIKFAQNDLQFGFGKRVCYNFVKIEMELANILALGKTILVLKQNFPFVTYANELFVTCGSVLQEFKTLIKQVPIGLAIENGIHERKKNNPEYIQQMMKQTEILLCLVKTTGGNPNDTLSSYIQTWQNMLPGSLSTTLLPTSGEPLRLTHLVALYEYLENNQADNAIDSLDEQFRRDLPKDVKKDLIDFLDSNYIPLHSVNIAFRRFVMRYLINFENISQMDCNEPLVEWMSKPSLWPEGVKENGQLDESDEKSPKYVKSEFPKTLNLDHTFKAIACIGEKLKEKLDLENRHHIMPPIFKATGSMATSASRPGWARERTKGRLGKT